MDRDVHDAEDAMVLRIPIESRRTKHGAQVGANIGYGAIGMAIGFRKTGGRLHSGAIDPANLWTARRNLESSGLSKSVTVINNVIVSARQMGDFLEYIQSRPNYDSVGIRASLHKIDGTLCASRSGKATARQWLRPGLL